MLLFQKYLYKLELFLKETLINNFYNFYKKIH